MTPLLLAVESNRIEMVECLLHQHADINLQDDNEVILHTNAVNYFELAGRSCPIVGAQSSTSKARFWLVVRMTVTLKPTIRNIANLCSYLDCLCLFHWHMWKSIISNHNVYHRKYFLKFVTFSHQQTPLHVAANKGHDYTVECLVKKGANINIKDKKGVSEKLYLWS